MTDCGIRPLVFLCVIARKDNGYLGFSIIRIRISLWGISFTDTDRSNWYFISLATKDLKNIRRQRNYRIIKKQRKKCESSEGVKWERGLVMPVYMRNMRFGPLGLSKFASFSMNRIANMGEGLGPDCS